MTHGRANGEECGDMLELRDEVKRLLGDAAQLFDDSAEELAAMAKVLDEPLTLAVAGHTSAGKSTLVNAFIGHRIAPTAATECTRVITWFRYGDEQAEIVCRDGRRQPLCLIKDPATGERRLPDHLPVDERCAVERLEVPRSFGPLRHLAVIDTPGLSGDEGLAQETEALLDSGAVDVLLFVLGKANIRKGEREVVKEFRRKNRSRYAFPGNAFGVLSKADTYPGPDSMVSASAVADAHATELRRYLAGVLPIMGRIAETVQTGALNQDHTEALNTIAALPDEQRTRMLATANQFLGSAALTDTELPRAQRAALVKLLAIHGIRELTGPAHKPGTPYDAMRQLSGIDTLLGRIDALFTRPRVVHKTTRILAAVERIARSEKVSETASHAVLDRVQIIRGSDAMHTLEELRALADLYSDSGVLGDSAVYAKALQLFEGSDPVRRLGCGADDPKSVREAAQDAISYWQAYSNNAFERTARAIAQTASRSASIIYRELEGRR